jgi:hypothetical protein
VSGGVDADAFREVEARQKVIVVFIIVVFACEAIAI